MIEIGLTILENSHAQNLWKKEKLQNEVYVGIESDVLKNFKTFKI